MTEGQFTREHGVLKGKKKKGKQRRTESPPKLIIPPPRPRVPRQRPIPEGPPRQVGDRELERLCLDLARANSWREQRELLVPLLTQRISYEQLSEILHRIPSLPERFNVARLLSPHVQDVEANFFLFIMSFATEEERETLSQILVPSDDSP